MTGNSFSRLLDNAIKWNTKYKTKYPRVHQGRDMLLSVYQQGDLNTVKQAAMQRGERYIGRALINVTSFVNKYILAHGSDRIPLANLLLIMSEQFEKLNKLKILRSNICNYKI